MDNVMDIEILDLCKENIQPLKKGRKASQLGLALQAEVNTEFQEKLAKERGEYELAIISYDGPDPLQPRIDYVGWMEQTHIKHGKDCNLIPLLEDTIILLKDNEKYKQDPRFIELVVKYIETQENAVELFQMVYSQGLGTMCSVLYKAWAEALDQANDFKRADQVYQLGIANRAEPVEVLRKAHEQFQLSVVRRQMITGELTESSNDEQPNQPRKVLSKLKKDVGSIRKPHGAPGVLGVQKSKTSSSKHIPIFQDSENNYDHLINAAIKKNKLSSIATAEKNNEENTMKAGSWNKGYNRKEVAKLPPVPSTPSFKVHVDPEAESETPKIVTKTPCNVLKMRKAEFSTNAMEVLGSGHSARKALQANLELYSGGREFSFEELRAAYYSKRLNPVTGILETPMKESKGKLRFSDELLKTPVQGLSSLSLECKPLSEKIERYAPADSCETPLKHSGFMPLTPLLRGEDISDLSETPSQVIENIPSKKTPLKLSVLSEDSSIEKSHSSYPVSKSDILPTIEENQEMENYSTPAIIKKPAAFNIRKKQLFNEKPVEKEVTKLKTNFMIFVDDD